MSIDFQIDSLSVAEKFQLMEIVWQSLCVHPADVKSPDWHRDVLSDRKRRLEDGTSSISEWSDAKARLLNIDQ